jgi:acyl-CoA synthetase (AMP-forming)/AMP-acid ligase II
MDGCASILTTHVAGLRLAVYAELGPAALEAARQADAGSWKQRIAAELLAHCRALLPAAAVPAAAVVGGQGLPRSPAGKLDRGALTEPGWTATHSNAGKVITAANAIVSACAK